MEHPDTGAIRQINALQSEADDLARAFREHFTESRQAHERGEHVLAKELSEKGRLLQSECQATNDRANALRRQLGASHIHRAMPPVATAEIAARSHTDPAARDRKLRAEPPQPAQTSLRRIPALDVAVFPPRLANLHEELKRVLPARFPAEDLAQVRSVVFDDRVDVRGLTTFRGGSCSSDGVITLYAAPPGLLGLSGEEATVMRTIGHELGHIAWRRVSELIHMEWDDMLMRHLGYCESIFKRYRDLPDRRLRREVFAEAYRDSAFSDPSFIDDYEEIFTFMRDRVIDR